MRRAEMKEWRSHDPQKPNFEVGVFDIPGGVGAAGVRGAHVEVQTDTPKYQRYMALNVRRAEDVPRGKFAVAVQPAGAADVMVGSDGRVHVFGQRATSGVTIGVHPDTLLQYTPDLNAHGSSLATPSRVAGELDAAVPSPYLHDQRQHVRSGVSFTPGPTTR